MKDIFIKFSYQMPPEDVTVSVKFGNGKIIKGKRNGNYMVYSPSDLDFETMVSQEKEWSDINPNQ